MVDEWRAAVTVEERLQARRRIRDAYRAAVAPGDREALLEVGQWEGILWGWFGGRGALGGLDWAAGAL